MTGYVVRRLLLVVPIIIGISVLVFVLLRLAPGDPVLMYVNPANPGGVSPSELEELRRAHGLDRPLYVQYLVWLKGVVTGDWGYSFSHHEPVLQLIRDRLPATLRLGASALVIAVAAAVPVGIVAAVRQGSWWDFTLTGLALVGLSVPNFWLALMLTELFSTRLGWLPAVGSAPFEAAGFLQRLPYAVLPVTVLAVELIAPWARYTRSSTLEVIRQDFIRTARAKGLSERVVMFRHILRNALLPIITLVSLSARYLVSGAFIIEAMFAWPGMGRLAVNAVYARDYPVIMGVTLTISVVVIVANLLADILYAYVDPRIRYQ